MNRLRLAIVTFFVVLVAACAAAAPFIAPLERAACVELRAESPSGTVDQICADADMLAPYVADIVAMQAKKPVTAKLAQSAPANVIALPLPTHPVERRRCTVWEHLPDRDGGADGD